ncbi:hypothetical protein TGAM01_v200704, partial [Trichoderma gamsii]
SSPRKQEQPACTTGGGAFDTGEIGTDYSKVLRNEIARIDGFHFCKPFPKFLSSHLQPCTSTTNNTTAIIIAGTTTAVVTFASWLFLELSLSN